MQLPILSLVCLGLGVLLAGIGKLILLVAAFRRSVVWGLVVLFAPLGNLIYVCADWTAARVGYLTSLVGVGFLITGFFTVPNLRTQIAATLHQRFPEMVVPQAIEETPKPSDLNTQIAEKRKSVEDLQATFAATGQPLPAQYQQLEQRRKALKPEDAAGIAKFNEDAAAYQAQNKRMKEMQQEIAATQVALDQLLDTRSRAAVKVPPAAVPAAAKSVVMYTTATCPACKMAKQYMAQKGIRYQEIDVQSSRDGREAFQKLGGHGVPLIMVGDKRMEGFNSQELERMLGS